MPPFNPAINPSNDPNYLGYSRPITQPEIDRSSAVAVKGAADLLEMGVKGADFVVKSNIDENVYAAIDAERNAYTEALEFSSQRVQGKPMNLLPSDPNLPKDVADVDGYLGNLKASRDANKISQTYYMARLNSVAKHLRAQYPGYREYIDAKVANITGVNPANAYVAALAGDINSALATAEGNKNQALQVYKSNLEIPGISLVYDHMITKGNGTPEQFMTWVNGTRSWEYEDKARKAALEAFKGSREVAVIENKDYAITFAGQKTSNMIMNGLSIAGMDTPGGVQKMMTDLAANRQIMDPKRAQETGVQVQTLALNLKNELHKEFFQRVGKDGKTVAARIGNTDEVNKIISDAIKPVEDLGKFIYNGEWGPVAATANAIKAMVDTKKYGMMQDPDFGEFATFMQASKDFGEVFQNRVIQESLNHVPNLGAKIANHILSQKAKMLNQTEVKNGGKPYTISDALLKDGKIPTAANQYINLVEETIANPDASDKAKTAIANATFSPENDGVLDNFRIDGINPSTGKPEKSRYWVFSRWTSQDIVDEMVRLGKKEEGVWGKFQNWVENNFENSLFRPDITQIKGIELNPNVKLSWASEDNRWSLRDAKTGEDITYAKTASAAALDRKAPRSWESEGFKEYQQAIIRLNGGMQSMARMYKAAGADPSAMLLQMFQRQGFDLASDKMTGIPAAMVNAIITEREAAKKVSTERKQKWGQ